MLEALALQQHESNFAKALERYNKAVELMERKGMKIPFEIYTNIGVLSHETRKFDKSLACYVQALNALDEDGSKREAKIGNRGLVGGAIRHKDNAMFFGYVDCKLKVVNPAKDNDKEGTTTLKVTLSEGKETIDLPVQIGDDIRLGDSFESRVLSIKKEGTGFVMCIADTYEGEKNKEGDGSTVEEETKEKLNIT